MIYLDHNATTPLDERVFDAMMPFLSTFYGNPSSLYRLGRVSRSAVESAREQVAALVQTAPQQVIFTSGGTEANNLAIFNAATDSTVAVSAVEHPSVMEPARARKSFFKNLIQLPVDADGMVQSLAIVDYPWQAGDFVSIMLANNETGVLQNVQGLAGKLKDKGVIVHTDAVQAVGKIPVSFPALNVDLLTLSGHKIYGPKGSGALIVSKDFHAEGELKGGGQESERRAGTENVAAIVGLGKAAELASQELDQRRQKTLFLRSMLEQKLHEIVGVYIFAEDVDRLPNTLMFSLDRVDGEMLLMQLDQCKIAVSSGSACASGGGHASPVLTAMGIPVEQARSSLRVSLGETNSEQDVLDFVAAIKQILKLS